MAEWRIRGYVADSDEEDDSQGSETVEDVDQTFSCNLLEQHDKPTEPQDQNKSLSQTASPCKGGSAPDYKGKANTSLGANVDEENGTEGDNHPSQENTGPIGDVGQGQSSSDTLKALIEEGDIDELQQGHYDPSPGTISSLNQVLEPLSTAQHQGPSSLVPWSPVARVAFANPYTKYPSSSPTHVERRVPDTDPGTVPKEPGSGQRLEHERPISCSSVNVVIEVSGATYPQQSPRPGRNLRHRNPIQLHPYAIESEQYRQVLKARGVKPLRIVQAQNESQENIGEDPQILDGTGEGESQELYSSQHARTPAPRSSSPLSEAPSAPGSSMARFQNLPAIQGDDFPDVDTLLRTYPEGIATNGFKRRKTAHTFSRKSTRAPHDRRNQESGETASLNDEGLALFDLLASPPPSSESRRPKTRTKIPKFKVPRIISPVAPPTPLASSEPLGPNLEIPEDGQSPVLNVMLFGDEESEASLLSDDSPSQQQPSNKVQRQFRGVLPASYRKFDQTTKSNKQSGFQRVISNGKDGLQRGIARRRYVHKSTSPSVGRESPIVLSDGEYSDVQPHSPGRATRTDTRRAEASLNFFKDDFESDQVLIANLGEVEEDNRIDEMLPTESRMSMGTRRRRQKIAPKPKDRPSNIRPSDDYSIHRKRRRSSPNNTYQPKITHRFNERRKKQPAFRPPRLSILDAPSVTTNAQASEPQFLKVALRTARSRKDRGRQSPSRKYLRLATSKDTEDIEQTLDKWRKGRIRPRSNPIARQPRKPLADLRGNNEILDRRPEDVPQVPHAANVAKARGGPSKAKPRKLQETLDQMVARNTVSQSREPKVRKYKYVPSIYNSKIVERSGHVVSSVGPSGRTRPATLEGLQSDRDRHRTAFQQGLSKITHLSDEGPKQQKRSLARKRAPRHLTPDHVDDNSPEAFNCAVDAESWTGEVLVRAENSRVRQQGPPILTRQSQTRLAQAGITTEAPNVLACLDQISAEFTTFDIQPLPKGAGFDDSTFIGSGDFQTYIRPENFVAMDRPRGLQTVQLHNETITIGLWNETAASQIHRIFETIHQGIRHNSDATANTFENAISILHGIMRYFSNHLSFADRADRTGFISECTAPLEQLSAELFEMEPSSNQVTDSQMLLGTVTIVLFYQLCQIANHDLVPPSLKSETNRLLAKAVKQVLQTVIRDRFLALRFYLDRIGLEVFHETPSLLIQEDSVPIQAIVIAHHVLIEPGGSLAAFWGVLNECISNQNPISNTNARSLEQSWQYTLILLPFLELDTQGKLEKDRRSKISCENWGPVRVLIDKVLDCYRVNPAGQHPKFNSYCRKLYARCFYLIKDWNWGKCDAIIGTLFDFFAQNQLAHLDHEEFWGNHGSPAFLEHLGENPSLVLSGGDRCFHILLKLIAEVLLRLCETGHLKKAQNLAFRVMPNHGRYLPKEKDIRQVDLDALRNHHDLLCTLYWASPPQHRPRLRAFRDLVDMQSSHRQACQLNVRAWLRLVKFQLSTKEPLGSLEPFADWHSDVIESTVGQHELARSEGESEAQRVGLANHGSLNGLELEPEIFYNESQVEIVLADALVSLESAIKAAQSNQAASILVKESLIMVFRRIDLSPRQSNNVVLKALDVVLAYTQRCRAGSIQSPSKDANDESQEYGDWTAFEEEEDDALSDQVLKILQGPLRVLLSNCFGADIVLKDVLLSKVVDTYTSLASVLVRQGHSSWNEYLSPFGQSSWQLLMDTPQKRDYHAYYLASLLELDRELYESFKDGVMNAWFASIVERETSLKFQHMLTSAVLNTARGDKLLRNPPFCIERISKRFKITPDDFSRGRTSLISTILENMWEAVNEAALDSLAKASVLKQQYNEWLRAMMSAMKRNYRELSQGPNAGGAYVDFVQDVIQALHRNTSAICPVDRFFTDSSEFPLPAADPTYVVGQLQNYGLRLREPRIPKQLAAFLQSLFERAVMSGQEADLSTKLHVAMSNTFETGDPANLSLRSFLTKGVLPSYIAVGFATTGGWVFLLPFLKALQPVFRTLFTDMSANHEGSIQSMANMLSSFLQDLWSSWQLLLQTSDWLEHPYVLHLLRECYLTVTSLLPVLDYIRRLHTPTDAAVSILDSLRTVAVCVAQGEDYQGILRPGAIEATVDPDYIAVRQFAHRELEQSLKRFWGKHSIGLGEMTAGLRSEEEKEGLVDAARGFLCSLGRLTSLSDQGGRVSRVTKECRFDDVMI